MIRKGLIFSYIATVMVLALATIVEKAHGTSYVHQYWYGSWWFTLLWAILVAFSVAWMVRCRMRRWQLVLLHASFVVILAGALLTKLTGSKGVMHLRQHKVTDVYIAKGSDGGETERHLPFTVRLDRFDVSYHEGTDAASDYQSQLTIVDGDNKRGGVVAMNKILELSQLPLLSERFRRGYARYGTFCQFRSLWYSSDVCRLCLAVLLAHLYAHRP